jgi:hypothetical protein
MARQRGGSTKKHDTDVAGHSYESETRSLIDDVKAIGLTMVKRWNTVDGDCCDICRKNAAEGWIDSEQAHVSGHMHPLAHPACRCNETYQRKGAV